jgi:hypothetical protein
VTARGTGWTKRTKPKTEDSHRTIDQKSGHEWNQSFDYGRCERPLQSADRQVWKPQKKNYEKHGYLEEQQS